MDLLQGKKLLQEGETLVSADVVLKKKTLILYYFMSSNNEKCKIFDDKLYNVYAQAVARKVEMGIVIVPCDSEPESFLRNVKSKNKNWYCVQLTDDLAHILIYNYGITHVPALVVVRKNGALVTKNGVKDIEEIGVNVLVTWTE